MFDENRVYSIEKNTYLDLLSFLYLWLLAQSLSSGTRHSGFWSKQRACPKLVTFPCNSIWPVVRVFCQHKWCHYECCVLSPHPAPGICQHQCHSGSEVFERGISDPHPYRQNLCNPGHWLSQTHFVVPVWSLRSLLHCKRVNVIFKSTILLVGSIST